MLCYRTDDMRRRTLIHRLFNPEVLGAAAAGAVAPYVIAYAIQIAPTRVPLWLVVLSVGGASSIAWLVRRVIVGRQDAREEKERRELERREYQTRLERLERTVAEIAPLRKRPTSRRLKADGRRALPIRIALARRVRTAAKDQPSGMTGPSRPSPSTPTRRLGPRPPHER